MPYLRAVLTRPGSPFSLSRSLPRPFDCNLRFSFNQLLTVCPFTITTRLRHGNQTNAQPAKLIPSQTLARGSTQAPPTIDVEFYDINKYTHAHRVGLLCSPIAGVTQVSSRSPLSTSSRSVYRGSSLRTSLSLPPSLLPSFFPSLLHVSFFLHASLRNRKENK